MQDGQIFEQRYRILREVGRGSYGIVYAAEVLQTGEHVAIKVLLPWVRADQDLRHRLHREAKLTRMLTSPHAVRVFDFAETADGDLYIVMELLDGEELAMTLKREGRLKPSRATEIGRQILDPLAESHRLGVIHRDLKPHNVLLCHKDNGQDFVKVLDFGIAKVAGNEDGSGLMETTRLTTPGNVVGTPAYMSPEQCRGEPLTPASDIYSVGVLLYEMVVGRAPFDDPNPMHVLLLHNTQPPPPMSPTITATPLGQAILRSLDKDPKDRFASAEEFLAAVNGAPVSGFEATVRSKRVPTLKAPAPAPPLVAEQSTATATAAATTVAASASPSQKASAFSFGDLLRRYWIILAIILLLAILAATHFLS